jgi:hypothetical protein
MSASKGAGRSPAIPHPIFFDGAKHHQKKLQALQTYIKLQPTYQDSVTPAQSH